MRMDLSREKISVFPLIFISSLACLSYEITLIRIFSISLWYHFAFMVISIAMLGIGASGALLAVFPRARDIRAVPLYGLLLALFIPFSYLLTNAVPFEPARLSWDGMQLLYLGLYCLVFSLPFFCFGLIIGTAYAAMTEQAGLVYASDLLGAGAGSLTVLLLLSLSGPEYPVFIIPLSICIVLWFTSKGAVRYGSLILLFVLAGVVAVNPRFMHPGISPYKPLELALKFPGAEHLGVRYSAYSRVDLLKSPAVRFAPGLSLRYLEPLPEQVGLAIDAGELHAITDERDENKLAFVRHLPSGLPYLLSRNEDALILEPKAGLSVLTARHYGAKNVFAVDSNPLVVKTVREYAHKLSSRIYEDKTETGLGRSWLKSQDKTFDVIDISLMGSVPGGSFGFAEDYRLTVEAFQTYLNHLKPDGFLSINIYLLPPPRTEFRLLTTLAKASEASGLQNISGHVAAIRSWGSLTMIVKKAPLSQADIRGIKSFSEAMRFDLVYYPGILAGESNRYIKMPGNEHFEAFRLLLDQKTKERFINNYLFDIRPMYDDKPFFHYYLRLENVKEIYRIMGEKWQYFIEEGYLLPALFVQVAALSLALIILPVVLLRKTLSAKAVSMAPSVLCYFCLLGLAYLFVLLMLIQKMVLALEHPAYAASVVFASILISSGLGGFLSRRFEALRAPRMLLLLAGFIVLYSIALPLFINATSPFPLMYKIPLGFLTLMPLGFLMGLPFPLGMTLLGKTMPWIIPWAWAANAFFSVLAPILASMIALQTGFQAVILGGAAMYVLGYLILRGKMGGN